MSCEKNISQSFPKLKKKKNEETISHSFPKKEEKNEDDIVICQHSEIVEHNGIEICIECGEQMSDYFSVDKDWTYYGSNDNRHSSDPSRCQYRRIPDKGIEKELEKMNFPIEICKQANLLYLKVTNGEIKRSNLRKGIMFACIFNAYKDIGNPQIPEELQTKFNIDRKNMSKGLTYFHMRNPTKKNSAYISVQHFIPKIMEKFNAKKEHIDTVLKMYEIIKNSSSIFIRSNPQSVSSSLVYYYLKKMDPDIPVGQFSKIVNLSEITILRIISEIENIVNK
jgi:transcription initiation factor TFIIIB Brf1 subunit/transcription initiation factor TFIIB